MIIYSFCHNNDSSVGACVCKTCIFLVVQCSSAKRIIIYNNNKLLFSKISLHIIFVFFRLLEGVSAEHAHSSLFNAFMARVYKEFWWQHSNISQRIWLISRMFLIITIKYWWLNHNTFFNDIDSPVQGCICIFSRMSSSDDQNSP